MLGGDCRGAAVVVCSSSAGSGSLSPELSIPVVAAAFRVVVDGAFAGVVVVFAGIVSIVAGCLSPPTVVEIARAVVTFSIVEFNRSGGVSTHFALYAIVQMLCTSYRWSSASSPHFALT